MITISGVASPNFFLGKKCEWAEFFIFGQYFVWDDSILFGISPLKAQNN